MRSSTLSSSWGYTVESTPNGRRHYTASPRPAALATHGHTPYLNETATRKTLNPTYALHDSIPITAARRPYRALPDSKVRTTSKPYVCPGCGIVPPRSGKCDQCWG